MPKTNKREEKALKNINFLRKTLELKELLFGQFSPTLTKERKRNAWSELRDYAVSIGLIGIETWPNLRNRTMVKVDKSKKTGEEGGVDSKIDEVDNLVLEIIGKKSPVVKGLGVPDSMEKIDAEEQPAEPQKESANEIVESRKYDEYKHENAEKVGTSSKKFCRKRVIVRKHDSNTKSLEELKRRKLELEIRLLELNVWEKERALSVTHSPLTENITTIRKTLFIDYDNSDSEKCFS